jgi:hypothetical protein
VAARNIICADASRENLIPNTVSKTRWTLPCDSPASLLSGVP